MKMSLFQIIAIGCLLAVGTLTVTPFLPKADASCNYFTEKECDDAWAYYAQKLVTAVLVCYISGGRHVTRQTRLLMLYECGLNEFVCMQIHKAQERHEFHSCNDRVGSKESTHFLVGAFSFCETFDKLKCYVDITLWGPDSSLGSGRDFLAEMLKNSKTK